MTNASATLPCQHSTHDVTALPVLPDIPRQRYLDPKFYQLELKHVFKKSWLIVGHESEYPKIGSYQLLDIPFAPVMVVKGKDGKLRALLNSCQHRGATVLREKTGCAKVMSCQYHGWTYDLTGQLIGVTSEKCFPGLNKTEHSLPQLRCEQWGGFVYINFDPKAEPLLDFLAPIAKRHLSASLAPLRLVDKFSTEVNCNWKAMVEAFYESYHVQYIHGATAAGMIDVDRVSYELYSNGHGTKFTPYLSQQKMDWDGAMVKSGLPRVPIAEGQAAYEDAAHYATCMFPNTDIVFQATTGFPLVQIWPISANQCRLDTTFYALDWGSAPRPAMFDTLVSELKKVVAEDMANMRSIQQSMQADPDISNILGGEEVLIYNFNAQIDKCIGINNIPEHQRVPDALAHYVVA